MYNVEFHRVHRGEAVGFYRQKYQFQFKTNDFYKTIYHRRGHRHYLGACGYIPF